MIISPFKGYLYFLQSDIFVKMYDTGENKMKRIAPQKEMPLLLNSL